MQFCRMQSYPVCHVCAVRCVPQAVGKLFMDDLTQALSLLFANERLSVEHYATLIDMAESHGNEVQSAWATRATSSSACNDCSCGYGWCTGGVGVGDGV